MPAVLAGERSTKPSRLEPHLFAQKGIQMIPPSKELQVWHFSRQRAITCPLLIYGSKAATAATLRGTHGSEDGDRKCLFLSVTFVLLCLNDLGGGENCSKISYTSELPHQFSVLLLSWLKEKYTQQKMLCQENREEIAAWRREGCE